MKKVMSLEGVKFDASSSMADNLKSHAGSDARIFGPGKTITGYVKSVGNGLVHMEKIAGRISMMS